mgnify:CR=1 FL=1
MVAKELEAEYLAKLEALDKEMRSKREALQAEYLAKLDENINKLLKGGEHNGQ